MEVTTYFISYKFTFILPSSPDCYLGIFMTLMLATVRIATGCATIMSE